MSFRDIALLRPSSPQALPEENTGAWRWRQATQRFTPLGPEPRDERAGIGLSAVAPKASGLMSGGRLGFSEGGAGSTIAMRLVKLIRVMEVGGAMATTEIKVYRDLMGENEKWARKTRDILGAHGMRMINIIGSPGCGKTRLLERMSATWAGAVRFAVLEGDVETTRDAERLHAIGVPVSQLLTGGSCHLEAKLVHRALQDLPLAALDLVVVENVGNLVCPAEFDVGEAAKVAVLSVTEGEDKPLKYPLLFREAGAIVLTKIDLLPHLSFDMNLCLQFIRQINARTPIFQVSAVTGAGMAEWCRWAAGR